MMMRGWGGWQGHRDQSKPCSIPDTGTISIVRCARACSCCCGCCGVVAWARVATRENPSSVAPPCFFFGVDGPGDVGGWLKLSCPPSHTSLTIHHKNTSHTLTTIKHKPRPGKTQLLCPLLLALDHSQRAERHRPPHHHRLRSFFAGRRLEPRPFSVIPDQCGTTQAVVFCMGVDWWTSWVLWLGVH